MKAGQIVLVSIVFVWLQEEQLLQLMEIKVRNMHCSAKQINKKDTVDQQHEACGIFTFPSRVPQHGVSHHNNGPPEDVSQDEDVKLL